MVFALMMVQGLSPASAQLTGRDLLQAPGYDAIFWMSSAGVLLLGLVLAGLYPAFILSAYPPAEVLKGRCRQLQRRELAQGLGGGTIRLLDCHDHQRAGGAKTTQFYAQF